MTQITNFNFSENNVTAMAIDETTSQYLWMAFSQDASGNCALHKTSAHDLDQIFYDLDIAVDEIKKMVVNGSYLYIAYDDSLLIGAKYNVGRPFTDFTDFTLPTGITEAPVDILVNSTNVYFLIPGDDSGTNTKIVEFTINGSFSQTINLATTTNAKSFTFDSNGDIWVATYSSSSKLVHIAFESGGSYSTTIHSI